MEHGDPWAGFRLRQVQPSGKAGKSILHHYFKVWDSYGLAQFEFRSGSFSQDARGRWYFNIVVEVAQIASQATGQVGIDLGLKDVATCSNGLKLESEQFYRELEPKLAVAQRANKKQRVKAIHAQIK
ncbi:MAG: hypothetical protein WAR97_04215, partial [Thiothrix eikelboomii]